jgi:hypothetical protein
MSSTGASVRERLMLHLDHEVWTRAETRAAGDGLTASRALEVLLDGYAQGTVTAHVPAKRRRAIRRPKRVSLTREVLNAVATKEENGRYTPRHGDARSLSVLAELLLAGYADGQVTVSVAAAGHADPETAAASGE